MINIDEIRVASVMQENSDEEISFADVEDGSGMAFFSCDDPEFASSTIFSLEGGDIVGVEFDIPDINDVLKENPALYDDIDDAIRESYDDLYQREATSITSCNIEIDDIKSTGEISFHGTIGIELPTAFNGTGTVKDGIVNIDKYSLNTEGPLNYKTIADTVGVGLQLEVSCNDIAIATEQYVQDVLKNSQSTAIKQKHNNEIKNVNKSVKKDKDIDI